MSPRPNPEPPDKCIRFEQVSAPVRRPCASDLGQVVSSLGLDPAGQLMASSPELFCDFERLYLLIGPPRTLVSGAMQLMMMFPAERYDELIANLSAYRGGLRELDVMRITRSSLAHQTWLD